MDSYFFQWVGIAYSGKWIGVAESEWFKKNEAKPSVHRLKQIYYPELPFRLRLIYTYISKCSTIG